MFDSGQPVGDDYGRAIGHDIVQRALDAVFRFIVQGRRGLIENQYRCVLENGTGDGYALALAAAEAAAIIAQHRLEPSGQSLDEVPGVS